MVRVRSDRYLEAELATMRKMRGRLFVFVTRAERGDYDGHQAELVAALRRLLRDSA